LVDIQVATAPDGTYALTGHSAKQFSAGGKKDLACVCIQHREFAYYKPKMRRLPWFASVGFNRGVEV